MVSPYFQREISVVVPPISRATVCALPIAPRADKLSTVAAGPVKAVSTGSVYHMLHRKRAPIGL